ncbi:MAG: serine/threonine protein kinase, partial [Planctomycetes bacterium]|nr:serine/threonine protein kinase [Planctomycetota bacterium]
MDAKRKDLLRIVFAALRAEALSTDDALALLCETNDLAFERLHRLVPEDTFEALQRDFAQDPAEVEKSETTHLEFGVELRTFEIVKRTPLIGQSERETVLAELRRVFPKSRVSPPALASDRYRIIEEHGRGGVGVVLRAIDLRFDREVAIKRLLVEKRGHADLQRMRIERFLREARVSGQLEHPNIVPVYDILDEREGNASFVMKFIHGASMLDRLREIESNELLDASAKYESRLDLLDAFLDVCNALSYAHSKGVVHRDLKPENIMLGSFGETLVVDWGLARIDQDSMVSGVPELTESVPVEEGRLTRFGVAIGTPTFMAPEQARGELDSICPQTDVYSLGAVLFNIVSGSTAAWGTSVGEIIEAVGKGETRSLREVCPEAPRELVAIVERAMAYDAKDRYQSANELADELRRWRAGRRVDSYSYSGVELLRRFVRDNQRKIAVVVLVLVTGLLTIGGLQLRDQERLNEARKEHQARVEALQAALLASPREETRARAQKFVSEELALRGAWSADKPV